MRERGKGRQVIWPVVYKVMANDIQTIYDQIDANNTVIKSFLEEGGIKPEEMYRIFENKLDGVIKVAVEP